MTKETQKLEIFSYLTSGKFDQFGKHDPASELFKHYAKLTTPQRIEVLRDRLSIFKKLHTKALEKFGDIEDKSVIEYSALVLSIAQQRSPSSTHYKKLAKGENLADHDAALAEAILTRPRRITKPASTILNFNRGMIIGNRQRGMSWRGLSELLALTKDVQISHTTIKRWYETQNEEKHE